MILLKRKKEVHFDKRALKEFKKFPKVVQIAFKINIETLAQTGFLRKPHGKKIKSYDNLFEIRVRTNGQWRAIYTYLDQDTILILNCLKKKSQKLLLKDINTSLLRLKSYK